MPDNVVRLPVIPFRAHQSRFWKAMDKGCNRAVKSWHRRAGKDITDFSYMVRAAVQRPGTYYYYFPTLEDAKGAIWGNIVEFWNEGKVIASGSMLDILCPKAIRCRPPSQAEHYIDVHARGGYSRIKLGGTDNLKVIGMNGYGYVFSEWQGHKKEAFGLVSPILRENGGWALFNGTMRGKSNHLYQDIQANLKNENWFCEWLKPENTKEYYWINEEEEINVNPELAGGVHPHTLRPYQNIQDLVDAQEISFYLARQEYLNEAVSNVGGAYYSYELRKAEREGRLNGPGWNPSEPVYTFWDLGGTKSDSDKTCILFAQLPQGNTGPAYCIDYYESVGRLRGHYLDYIASRPYKYGGHYLPHDAKKTNEYTGEDMAETARLTHNIEMRYIPKTNSVANDIEIIRRGLSDYHVHADLDEYVTQIGNYHEKETTQKPCHQNNCMQCRGASHAADTLRAMGMARHLRLIEPYMHGVRKIRALGPSMESSEWMCV